MNHKIKIEIAIGLIAVIALAVGMYILNNGQEVEAEMSMMQTGRQFKPGMVCIDDAKACPDGSYVSRVGPMCNFAPCPKIKNESTEKTQIVNPASVNCQQGGGQVEIRTDAAGGQVGYCKFENGSECEEWKFMRGECTANNNQKPAIRIPNWQTYINRRSGYQIQYPTNVNITENADRRAVFIFPNNEGSFSISTNKKASIYSLADVKKFVDNQNKKGEGYPYTQSVVKVSGIDASKLTRYDLGVIEKYYIPNGNSLIEIDFEFNFSQPNAKLSESNKKTINKILSTLNFTK